MGNIYVTCARCNKGMTIAEYNCVFCSDIDNQIVCADCYKKEQPKELMKKITDLEAKLAESERQYQEYRQIVEKDIEKELDERMRDTIKEFNLDISQLKQQLAEKETESLKYFKEYRAWKEKCELLEQDRNQTAITELNNILDTFAIFVNEEKESMVSPDGSGNLSLLEYVENRIDALKG